MLKKDLLIHLMPYLFGRIAVGILILIGGLFMGSISWSGITNPPKGIAPLIILFLIIMSIGMAIVLPIAGIYVIVKAFSTFNLSVGASPEETIRRFLKELLGGDILPSNPVAAFVCLSRQKQDEIQKFKALASARRSFKTFLKQKYQTNGIFFEVKSVDVIRKEGQHESTGTRVEAKAVVNAAPLNDPGQPRCWQPQNMTFELSKEQCGWRINSLQGGPAEFINKPFHTNFSDPLIRRDLKLAYGLIISGWISVAIGVLCVLLFKLKVFGDAAPIHIAIFVGVAGLILLANGYSKRARYR